MAAVARQAPGASDLAVFGIVEPLALVSPFTHGRRLGPAAGRDLQKTLRPTRSDFQLLLRFFGASEGLGDLHDQRAKMAWRSDQSTQHASATLPFRPSL